jgi:hypothetical protein
VELCVQQIFWFLIVFRLRLCGWVSNSFDLQFSSFTMIIVVVRWYFGILVSTIAHSSTTSFADFGDGGAMTARRLRLVLVLVILVKWSNDFHISYNFFKKLYG